MKPAPSHGSHRQPLQALRHAMQEALRRRPAMGDAILACILSHGHILLEDVPGVGKTTFIKALAQLLGLDMKRIQFTSDLLPAEIIGVQVYDPEKRQFQFHRGPLFSNILLADELNRASPKTQSALLEAMAERSVTIDRQTWSLPEPFLVVAAQNPSDHTGTFPIPESQLDRFAIKVRLDYPDPDEELAIFQRSSLDPLADLPSSILSREQILDLQGEVERVHVSEQVARCVQAVVQRSRNTSNLELGLSTRGGILWIRLARALALIKQRDFVSPDDLLELAPYCLPHRLALPAAAAADELDELLKAMVI